jgi:hypothetical protein
MNIAAANNEGFAIIMDDEVDEGIKQSTHSFLGRSS